MARIKGSVVYIIVTASEELAKLINEALVGKTGWKIQRQTFANIDDEQPAAVTTQEYLTA